MCMINIMQGVHVLVLSAREWAGTQCADAHEHFWQGP